MHGWVQDMNPHPQFHWARANGWGLMTKIELLDALPANHPGRAVILGMLKEHVNGLAAHQAAEQGETNFVDLNKLAVDHYDQEGEQKVRATYFNTTDGTHTIEAGAKLNAQLVVEGLNELKNNPLRKYLKTK